MSEAEKPDKTELSREETWIRLLAAELDIPKIANQKISEHHPTHLQT